MSVRSLTFLPGKTHTNMSCSHLRWLTCGDVRPRSALSTHTLINPVSVWPLEPDLQKSNQYVNSVISVKSVTMPFTQKPEVGAFQSCSTYLWYEIQILYNEGDKHRRDGGYRAATFFPWRFGEHATLVLPLSLPFSLSLSHTQHTVTRTISYKNISPSSNVQRLLGQHGFPPWEADQRRSLHSTCFTDRPP